MTQNSRTGSQPRRRRELDAMGMLVVVGLVFFHSAQIFYYGDFYVKNEPPNLESVSQLVSTLFVAFAGLWGMPLMFLIAGLAVWYSLRKRTAGQFALERTRRLVVPLVVGTLLLVPPIVYFGQKADPTYTETYLQFLPRFFNVQLTFDFPRFLTGAPPDELFTIAHLWFLEYLFVFTLGAAAAVAVPAAPGRAAPGGSIRGFLRASVGHLLAGAAHCHHRGGTRDRVHRWLESLCLRPVPHLRLSDGRRWPVGTCVPAPPAERPHPGACGAPGSTMPGTI